MRLQQVLLFLSIGFPIVLGYFDDEGFHGPFNDRHHTPAFEDNVFSQGYDEPAVPFTDAPGASPFSNDDTDSSACLTNQDGFGGSIGTNIFTVNYAYEMELKSNRIDTLETIIFKLERNVADFFLQSTDFSNVPCRRQLRQKLAHLPESNDSRRLVPVGLSINPRDQVNTQSKFTVLKALVHLNFSKMMFFGSSFQFNFHIKIFLPLERVHSLMCRGSFEWE